MPTAVGPNTFGEENLVFGYDLGDGKNSFPGIPAVNCAPVPTSKGSWSVTEITDGSIAPPRKGARVFKFVAGTTSNLYRHSGYYGGGGFTNNNNVNPLILGRTSPDNFTTVSEANKYRWGFWVRGVESNNAGWSFNIDIGDRGGASYVVGNKTDWYFISCDNATGTNYNAYPYDFFDIFTANQGLTIYVADMGIMRSPGTVDNLPIMQAYPQWVDYGQERTYTEGLIDLKGTSTIDITNVSFDSNAQMEFDGTDDYVSLGNPTVLRELTSGTIETVYYRDASTGTYQMVFTDGGSDLEITYSGNVLQFYIGNSGLSYTHAVTGQYFYVTGTWGSGFKKLYLNGVEVASGTNTGIDTGNRDRFIGGRGTSFSFNGKVPMVKVLTRALTSSEIQANYNAIKGRFNIE